MTNPTQIFTGRNKARRHKVSNLTLGVICLLAGIPLSASAVQDEDSPSGVRNSVNFSSAYLANNHANNIDYAQFKQDMFSATGRLALYGSEKLSDYVNGPVTRTVYLLSSTLIVDASGLDTSYHEWGHASRAAAMGSGAKMFNCTNSDDCVAPRDFFGYAKSQLFNYKCGAVESTSELIANKETGRAKDVVFTGAGVNNSMLSADKYGEAHFLKGTDNIFGYFLNSPNQTIVGYGPTADISSIVDYYNSSGVAPGITSDKLFQINRLSWFSGAMGNVLIGAYDFATTGKTEVKPWTIKGVLVPNQYNYLTSRGITRKWVSGYEWNDTTKLLGSYEYVVRGDKFAEPGVGIYKNFGDWDALFKVSGKTVSWANWETSISKRLNKNWKLTATAYVWDSRSLLGERNSLQLKDNKTSQASVGVAYEY